MSIDIRLPNINATSESGKLQQMQSYMIQLVQQLNWALNTIEAAESGNTNAPVVYQQSQPSTAKEAEETFNSIKALIIKSADIVNAYETTIFSDFNSKYFAESDFGTYLEETNRKVEENSKGVSESYKQIQAIDTDIDDIADYINTTEGYIRRGILDDQGTIGIEVGETSETGTYHRYARFTAEKLSFYDINGSEVVYIGAGDVDKSDSNCLYVRGKAVFLGEIQLGQYKTDSSDGLAFTWIGG